MKSRMVIMKVCGIDIVGNVACRMNSWTFEGDDGNKMAEHIQNLDNFLRDHMMRLVSIAVE